MASFKRLKRSDIISVPYVANKKWVFDYSPYPSNDQYIKIYKGTNLTGSFSLDYDPVTEGQYERLIYSQINHLFYQQYSASTNLLSTSSLISSLYYDGASSTPLTSSNFIYNDNPALIKYFPTGANEGIRVLAVDKDLYGQQLLPYAFNLSSSVYNIKDDGIGNLFDYSGSTTHVGNVFYSHGLAVITNQDYQLAFPLPPLAPTIYSTFPTSSTSKVISVTSSVDGRGGFILTGSIQINNTSSFTVDGSGSVTCTETSAGTYTAIYTISSSFTSSIYSGSYLISNPGKIIAYVYNDIQSPTPTPTPSATPVPTATPYVVPLNPPNPPQSVSTSTILGVIPENPTNLRTKCSGSNAILLSWDQPSTYIPTQGYIIGYRKEGSSNTFTEFLSPTSSFDNVKITGLSSNINYEGYVKSYNGGILTSDGLSWYRKCTT